MEQLPFLRDIIKEASKDGRSVGFDAARAMMDAIESLLTQLQRAQAALLEYQQAPQAIEGAQEEHLRRLKARLETVEGLIRAARRRKYEASQPKPEAPK